MRVEAVRGECHRAEVAAAALGQALLPAGVGYLAQSHGLTIVTPVLLTGALVVVLLHETMGVTAVSPKGRTVTSR